MRVYFSPRTPWFRFASPRIKSTNPFSQAVVCSAIIFTTSSTRAAMPQTSLPTPNASVNLLVNLHCPTSPSPRSSSALLSSFVPHSRLPSPWNTSSATLPWFCHSFRSPDLCAKSEPRTVSCERDDVVYCIFWVKCFAFSMCFMIKIVCVHFPSIFGVCNLFFYIFCIFCFRRSLK